MPFLLTEKKIRTEKGSRSGKGCPTKRRYDKTYGHGKKSRRKEQASFKTLKKQRDVNRKETLGTLMGKGPCEQLS